MKFSVIISFIGRKFKEEDKVKHILWSFWLTVFSLVFLPIRAAFILVFFIGLTKEIWDHYFGSGFCFYDMFANFVGISVALFGYLFLIWSLSLV
jgi:hypothetical protein